MKSFLAIAFLVLGLALLAGAGTSAIEFSCEGVFGAGYTSHPDFPYSCCKPGTVPVQGEQRCVAPGAGQGGAGVQDQSGSGATGGSGSPGGHCIPSGATCTLHGAPCCVAGESCQGKFPNTSCQ